MKPVLLKPLVDQVTIQCARDLLARCESGEVVAFTVLEENPGNRYTITGSAVSSKTQTAGMLLDAAITRLQQQG